MLDINVILSVKSIEERIMMKTYNIGEVAEKIGISTYTLRFYDKEGLLPNVHKNSAGLRRFTQEDINWLNILNV